MRTKVKTSNHLDLNRYHVDSQELAKRIIKSMLRLKHEIESSQTDKTGKIKRLAKHLQFLDQLAGE